LSFNWTRSRATVAKLIKKYGRLITFVNDAGPADPTLPLGPAAARFELPNIPAVFVRPSGYIKLGESAQLDPGMWPEADKICLVLPSLVHDFSKFTRVIDTDGAGYKLYKTELLKPGPVPVLIYIGLVL
jgi:hypothetical protein